LAQEQQFIWQVAWGYLAHARLQLAQGNLPGAETAAQSAEQWIAAHEVPVHISCEAAGLLAELWLRQGKTSQAARYLEQRDIQVDGGITFPHQFEYLAWARLKWMQGDEEGALDLLARTAHWAEAQSQTGVLIAAFILQAGVNQSRGNRKTGLTFLEQALELAEPEGYAQIFVNEGQPMAVLLREAVKQKVYPEYAGRLLALFTGLASGAPTASQPGVEPGQRPHSSPETTPLVEPLSRREMETLRLMAEGYSNKEIAQKLFISLRTVKYYSTGIYNKLGVDGRMQAVNRAREAGLL
jgi:LuxR family maltose regulon positive regulatory protein